MEIGRDNCSKGVHVIPEFQENGPHQRPNRQEEWQKNSIEPSDKCMGGIEE